MFRQWLVAAGVEVDVRRPYAGEDLPERVDHGGLVVLGGSISACDDLKAPWLPQVRTLLAETTAHDLPVLGICLGAQLLAAACGGRVEPSQTGGEVGLGTIDLTDESRRDLLFAGISPPVQAVQWHHDEITQVPDGAVVLGTSSRCPVQAYRIGDRAWGVQFHPEVDGATAQAWAADEARLSPELLAEMEAIAVAVLAAETHLFECWQGFAERFAGVVKAA
jgi:GMP synthase-like glutamine amidotransferase